MPRLMSFALTTDQFLDGSKTVTRRMGWQYLKPGDIVTACPKAMGLKKGETVQRLGDIEIISVRREALCSILPADVVREGFPGWSCEQFIEMYCRANNCTRYAVVTRIEFRRIDAQGVPAKVTTTKPHGGPTVLHGTAGDGVVLLPAIRQPRLVTSREVAVSYRRNEKRCVVHGLNCIA